MKESMKSMALKTAQGLVLLVLLALLVLSGAGISRSHSASGQAGAQIAATNGTVHIGGLAATNGGIHIGSLAASEGDIHVHG
jgi:hypothetical protein